MSGSSEIVGIARLAQLLLRLAPGSPWLAELAASGAALLPVARVERVVATWSLSRFEVDTLLLALLPDIDDRFADVFAQLGSPARRPTLGLLLRTLLPNDAQRWQVQAELLQHTLWAERLVRTTDVELPASVRPVRVSPVLATMIRGELGERVEGLGAIRTIADADVELATSTRPSLRAAVDSLVTSTVAVGPGVVHLPTTEPVHGELLAAAVARALGHPALVIRESPADLGDLFADLAIVACLARAVPVLHAPDGRVFAPPRRWGAPLPLFVLTDPTTDIRLADADQLRSFRPPGVRPDEQAALWRALLAEVHGDAQVELLANQTRLDPTRVRRIVTLATTQARAQGRAGPRHAEVIAALAEVSRPPSSPLATVSRPAVPWSSLVLPPDTLARLEELRDRVRWRLRVHHDWGMSSPTGRGDGVIALLHGESGTGKTHAAEALACALALPLVQVDLSRVVSKYIGETEKHLGEIFERAEGFGALLFFDEADALFGKRTGVRDAHDRYANIETNYLLQRLEQFAGMAILSTNLFHNLDDAFLRRIPFVIHLPRPSQQLQRRLWAQHLPDAACEPGLDAGLAATRYDLVGGEIRGAALTAAFAAAAAGGRVTSAQILDAARRELVKKGRPIPVQ